MRRLGGKTPGIAWVNRIAGRKALSSIGGSARCRRAVNAPSRPRDSASDNIGKELENMKTIVALAVASVLLASASGCSSCRNWFGWNKGASCDQPQECGYGGAPVYGAPVIGAPVYPGPTG
jgi:hypothetical protein